MRLKTGDLVIAANGVAVHSGTQLRNAIGLTRIGDEVKLTVDRAGNRTRGRRSRSNWRRQARPEDRARSADATPWPKPRTRCSASSPTPAPTTSARIIASWRSSCIPDLIPASPEAEAALQER